MQKQLGRLEANGFVSRIRKHAAQFVEPLESRQLMTSVLQPFAAVAAADPLAAAVDASVVGPFAIVPEQTTSADALAPARNEKPTITLAAVSTSATAPTTVTLTADASDADGVVTRVDFYRGSKKLGSDVE